MDLENTEVIEKIEKITELLSDADSVESAAELLSMAVLTLCYYSDYHPIELLSLTYQNTLDMIETLSDESMEVYTEPAIILN